MLLQNIDSALEDIIILLDIDQGHAQDCAVRRNKRQINSEGIIKSLNKFLKEHFNELHKSRNNQDKTVVFKYWTPSGTRIKLYSTPRQAGKGQDKGQRHSHSGSRLGFIRNTEKGTDA